jgi:hypothetical protein
VLVGVVLSWNLVRAAWPIRDAWAEGGRVRASAAISTPVTVGGSIVLPSDCVGWAESTQRAVLAHERAHVAGGDFYLLLLSQLNRVLFWFSPLSWWLHCRLASLAELTSDDAAMDALGDGPGYAAILLEIASRSAPMRGAVAMARLSTVCRRIERILAQDERPKPAHWRARGLRHRRCAAGAGHGDVGCRSRAAQQGGGRPTARTPHADRHRSEIARCLRGILPQRRDRLGHDRHP